ncbi:ABC transporter permease [Chitinimonas arctica]|uniref:ABC transporter permease n=1 Tax=Chitinimonas arctica TaxID=2594795 RepID=A0A516SCS4_9NEIS|nr:FtsX-like permease family protein [Chitinimonas arctica]QDQ25959.1 ABC transporter permease [Chitinimonas arctica]
MTLERKLAIRNLLRNRQRSLLTSVMIIVTVSLMILFQGLSDGGHRAMVDIGIKMGLGHVLVYQRGYNDDPALDRLMRDSVATVEKLRATVPEVQTVVRRLHLNGLIQAGANGVPITLSGVEPAAEQRVSRIADRKSIVSGLSLADLPPRQARHALPGIVIGQQLAGNLEVGVGDRVTLSVKPKNGSDLSREAFQVTGIFKTGMQELDAFWAELDLADAQRLARLDGEVSMLALYLEDVEQVGALAARLAGELPASQYEVLRWDQVAPELHSAVTLDAAGMYLLMVIVFVVVAAAILNTILISVMKRTREFGVMLALGASPGLVVRVVFWEALFLALFCIAVGATLGLAGHYHFATEGLNFREVFGTTLEAGGVLLPDRFYSFIYPGKLLFSLIFVLLLTLLVTIYPAVKASRLAPVEATRYG